MTYKSLVLPLLILVCSPIYGQEDFANINLDTYLIEQNAGGLEGYVTPSQKIEFIYDMQKLPQIKKIMEIGFNAGHSAELFLTETDCEKMVSFDINIHSYLKIGVEFITKKFGDRFNFIEGDSKVQVPKYTALHTEEKFDLIFIDGDHSFVGCLSDIQNCAQLAHRDTLVFIDDYVGEVKTAVDTCAQMGLISIEGFKYAKDDALGDRIWVVAHYLNQ